ncbi:MAG: preprotein translocase subunit SecA [Bacteroidales bacterium]|jgi:preprotein translocase subunit SecA|nr:preprotein translocase subunit SecA [Bacteroidales bacterium]
MSFNDILTKLFGNKSQRDVKAIQPWVEKVKEAYPAIEKLSNDELRARSQALMQQMQDMVAADRAKIKELRANVEKFDVDKREKVWAEIDDLKKKILKTFDDQLTEILPEVFAIVKQTAYRFANNETVEVTATQMDRDLAATKDFVTIEGDKAIYKTTWQAGGNPVRWDMVHYDVQLFGGVVLHQGKIAEMATGEGKTLVATLPVFLNAMTHNGVHVVTVNDYLAKRDCEWMGPLYQFHGLSVDCIDRYEPNSDERRQAYNCDITFGTNNEFGFDYLRDNMAMRPEDLVQREHNFAIVDEVDSVLIDDARTPLIISGPTPRTSEYSDEELYQEFRPRVEKLVNAQKTLANQLLNEAKKKVLNADKQLRDEGAVQLYRAYRAWPKSQPLIKFLSEQGVKQEMLRAEASFLENNMQRMPEALEPLYFAIEEKNKSVDLTDKGIEMLTGEGEDPKFFVLPDVGSEMADIEQDKSLSDEERAAKKEALLDQYTTKGERVHAVNQLLKAYTMFEKDVDYIVSEDGKVKIVDEQTGRIMEGRRWSDGLHQAVEAKEHVKIEQTTQTFATITLQNYFRMYHKLSGMTGTAETEAGEFWDIYKLDVVSIPTNRPVARIDMDDRIYRSKRAKYKAVIAQAKEYVAQGRPVLIGTTSVEISELLDKAFRQNGIIPNVLNAKLHQREAEIVAKAGMASTVTIATNMAGRGTDIKLSPEIKAAGGLAIIGTERHESRRVDRQLRGRAGRQGDPGSSVFFVSLEDNLMRIFGSDRIAKLMDSKMFGMTEDDVLESSLLSSSIEKAQKKVEENNYGIRKRLLEYDDVLNKQREVVYTRRRHALMGERIGVDFMNMAYDVAAELVKQYNSDGDADNLKTEIFRNFGINMSFDEKDLKVSADELANKIFEAAMENFNRRGNELEDKIGPQLVQIYERFKEGGQIKNVIVPFTDGKRIYQIPVNLQEAAETNGHNIIKTFLKVIILHVIDEAWKENLRDLDDLKQSVQNAHYEQKDPLLIYKVESYGIFERMVTKMNNKAVKILMRSQLHIPTPPPSANPEAQQQSEGEQFKAAAPERRQDFSRMQASHAQMGSALANETRPAGAMPDAPAPTPQPRRPIVAQPHVGRNDPCPCGSGLKYKNCHGKNL